MSLFIGTGGTIKVGAPGVDAATAGDKDLVLSIGQRTGQLLQTGVFTMSDDGVGGGTRDGSASIGPFDRAPEVIGYGRNVGGDTHYPSCIVSDEVALAFIPQVYETFVCLDMTITKDNIRARGFARSGGAGVPQLNGFAYIIYRKPNRG